MDLKYQKRVAAELLKCGESRVWIDPNRAEDVADAITRSDQKAKGRRRGQGSRRGRKHARKPSKETWMQAIRPIRRRLRELRDGGTIDTGTYRKYYMQAKGGVFKNRSHLDSHLRSEGVIKE
jgi:large subunit ribosomal protein L19e